MADDLDGAVAAYRDAQEAIGHAQEQAREVVAEARRKANQARLALAAAIVAAARAGVRQKDIAARTGYTRETVRRICREGGVEPDD